MRMYVFIPKVTWLLFGLIFHVVNMKMYVLFSYLRKNMVSLMMARTAREIVLKKQSLEASEWFMYRCSNRSQNFSQNLTDVLLRMSYLYCSRQCYATHTVHRRQTKAPFCKYFKWLNFVNQARHF